MLRVLVQEGCFANPRSSHFWQGFCVSEKRVATSRTPVEQQWATPYSCSLVTSAGRVTARRLDFLPLDFLPPADTCNGSAGGHPLQGPSLPGEHLFQASALPRNRMRPAIFRAFGKAKVGAQAALRELELQGWETLPIATLLGRPSVARPVFAVVFGPQTGAHENHFFSIP